MKSSFQREREADFALDAMYMEQRASNFSAEWNPETEFLYVDEYSMRILFEILDAANSIEDVPEYFESQKDKLETVRNKLKEIIDEKDAKDKEFQEWYRTRKFNVGQ